MLKSPVAKVIPFQNFRDNALMISSSLKMIDLMPTSLNPFSALAHNISLMTQTFSSVSFMCISTSISVFGEISHPGNTKESPCNRYKGFFLEKELVHCPHIMRNFFWIHHV
jgi:hypothetical protein